MCVIVLAGGAGRRIGGPDKPNLEVAGETMVARVLGAAPGSRIRVVVGPPDLEVPDGVAHALEDPPGGGPVAAVAAGLRALGPEEPTVPRQVAVLACDLPFLTADALAWLSSGLARTGADVAVYRDPQGHRQLLCGVWWERRLRTALPAQPAGVPMRALFAGLNVAEVDPPTAGPPPWYDCDTPEELAQARAWAGAA
jgi:molybdenum cofactor guanylyltransferase